MSDEELEQEPLEEDEYLEDEGPVDQLGIPMSREPTIDDVRGDGRQHRNLALGCTVAVIVLLAAFWLVRVVALG